MVKQIDAHGVLRQLQAGTQLVEVLPAKEYHEQHIPGALSIPLKQLDQDAVEQLDPARPVIVYCWDSQ